MKWQKLILVCVGLVLGSSLTVFAEDKVEFEFTSDFNGKYIWRGQNLVDDPVFQPGLSASYQGLTASIWGNLDLTNVNGNSGDFSEIDYTIDYSNKIPDSEIVGFSVGAIYYDFPGTAAPGTTELYGGLSLDTFLSPSVTFYRDIDEADGLYISVGMRIAASHALQN